MGFLLTFNETPNHFSFAFIISMPNNCKFSFSAQQKISISSAATILVNAIRLVTPH